MTIPNINPISDETWLADFGYRLAQQRIQAGLTQSGLAGKASVGKRTVERLEAGESTQLSNLLRILRALGLASELNALIPQAGPSPMELLKMKSKERKRASSPKKKQTDPVSKWTWGDQA